MKKNKVVIVAGINDEDLIKDSKELSDIVIGEDFNVDDLMNVTEKSGKRQKQAAQDMLVTLQHKIFEMQMNIYDNDDKIRNIEKQLREHPTIKALRALKKQNALEKKGIIKLAAIYQGSARTLMAVGIPVDAKVIKALKESTWKEA